MWIVRNFCIITWEIFRKINSTLKFFTKEVVLTENLKKKKTRDTIISQTPHCVLSMTRSGNY